MKESDLTKLGRWAIPGWVALLAFVVFCAIYIWLSPNECSKGECLKFRQQFNNHAELLTSSNPDWVPAALVIAAGIPLGFIVYQAYFYLRWNSPFSKDGLPALMSGRREDLHIMQHQLAGDLAAFDGRKAWRKKWLDSDEYRNDHKNQWRYIELLFMEAAQNIDSRFVGASFYQRHRYLHEIIHTIGAAVGAVYIGFFAFQLYLGALVPGVFGRNLLISVSVLLILLYLLHRENLVQGDPGFTPVKILGFSTFDPSASLLLFIVMFIVLFNPVLNVVESVTEIVWSYSGISLLSLLWLNGRGKEQGTGSTTSTSNDRDQHRGDKTRRSDTLWFAGFLCLFLLLVFAPKISFALGLALLLAANLLVYINRNWRRDQKIYFFTLTTLPFTITLSIFSVFEIWIASIDWGFLSALGLFLLANLILLKNRKNAADDMLALENYLLKLYIYGGHRQV